jgi:hypothetical protein
MRTEINNQIIHKTIQKLNSINPEATHSGLFKKKIRIQAVIDLSSKKQETYY